MQMSIKHGFAFLCTPKCASTSIEAAIKDECNINFSGYPAYKHINAQAFSDKILSFHRAKLPSVNIESFCLIREPLEWIASWYRFRMRDVLRDPAHPYHKNYTGNIGYDEFIKNYIAKGKRPPFANLSTQYDFMKLDTGIVGVDHVFPMEKMDLVGEFLSNKIGKQIEIPVRNVSPPISVGLDKSLEEQLRHYLSNDIALYEFVVRNGKFDKKRHVDEFFAVLHGRRCA